jgi:flavin reductase ActVB
LENTSNLFRESMGRLASGVSIVTTEFNGRPWGLTISACTSISMEPPLLMISLANTTVSAEAIRKNEHFDVSVLNQDQLDVAKYGSQRGMSKYFEDYIDMENSDHGYIIKNALANIHCRVENMVVAGDHTIFIGLVKNVVLGEFKDPLLYYYRSFGSFTKDLKSLK